ncbi:hypothetical protein Ciccas_003455 [Cichlidogyrus casuarinus]|uniref:Uncharacterized protein n=1 Tax=Cichlidogyrus casuarinus TaxID=1844966 RepID=A0ABD2QEC8_9PLAT
MLAAGSSLGHVLVWDLFQERLIYTIAPPASYEPSARPRLNVEFSISRESSLCLYEEPVTMEDRNEMKAVCGLYFCATTGDLVVLHRNSLLDQSLHVSLYSASGELLQMRMLDFYAEIPDDAVQGDGTNEHNSETDFSPPILAIPQLEGTGVDCLIVGGNCGKIVWLSNISLDTIRTFQLPQLQPSTIVSMQFVPRYCAVPQFSSFQALSQRLLCIDASGQSFLLHSDHNSDL